MAAGAARTPRGSPGIQPGLTRHRRGGLRRRSTRSGIGDFGRRRARARALLCRGGPRIRGGGRGIHRGKQLDFALRSSGCDWTPLSAPIPCRNPGRRSRNRRRISMPPRRRRMNPQRTSMALRQRRRSPPRRCKNFGRKKAIPYRMPSPRRRRRQNRRGRSACQRRSASTRGAGFSNLS
jgi:hypothetical protein